MGSSQSVPAKVFAAVRNGSLPDVQSVLQTIRRSTTPEEQRRALFAWMDPTTGMTILMLAASRNMVEIMKLLLAEGADPHVMSGKARGTALHEAVAAKHEAAVELLLQYRADPFLENTRGETSMDLAVVSGNVKLVRRLERCALFSGMVNMKMLALRGFASANKDRWAVVMPRFLPPKPGQAVGVVRMVLWVYRDACGIEPRTKVWLDGASAFKVGPEDGIVRLHPNHEQPKNASTRYDRGWLLFFRPAAAAASPAGAREAFNRFIDCCNRPLDYLAAATASATSGSGSGSATQAPPAWPPQQQPQAPAQQVRPPQQQQPQPPAAPPPAAGWVGPPQQHLMPAPGSPAAVGGAAYPSIPFYDPNSPLQQPPPASSGAQLGRPLSLRPANAPPPSGLAAPPTPTTAAGVGAFGGGSSHSGSASGPAAAGPGLAAGEYDPLVARPGESDEAFAQRLSRMYGSFSAAAGQGASGGGGGSGSGRDAARPAAAAAAAASTAAAVEAAAAQDAAPSAPPVSANPFLADMPPGAAAAVAPAAAPGAGAGAAGDGEPDEDDLCVLCLTNVRAIGFLHGSSVHRCVCTECAPLLKVGDHCPLCRAPIAAILNVY